MVLRFVGDLIPLNSVSPRCALNEDSVLILNADRNSVDFPAPQRSGYGSCCSSESTLRSKSSNSSSEYVFGQAEHWDTMRNSRKFFRRLGRRRAGSVSRGVLSSGLVFEVGKLAHQQVVLSRPRSSVPKGRSTCNRVPDFSELPECGGGDRFRVDLISALSCQRFEFQILGGEDDVPNDGGRGFQACRCLVRSA